MAAGRTFPAGRRLKCVWFTSLRCETVKFRRKLSSIWGAPCNCRNQAITPIEEWYRLEIPSPKSLAGSLPGSVLTNGPIAINSRTVGKQEVILSCLPVIQ